MKNIFLPIAFLFITSSSLVAQKVYFIYLQTDNQQPFYARMGEKVYNSTSSGFLILSNLHDSVYSVNIGIQGSQAPDQPYSITVNRKDQGFLIKNLGEKGWGLLNLSSMAVIMPSISSGNTSTAQFVKTEKREDNAFTNLLAKAADDSTIKERPVIEKPEVKKIETPTSAIEKKEEPKNEQKETVPPKTEEIKKEIIPVEKKEVPKNEVNEIKNQVVDSENAAKAKADSITAAKKLQDEFLKKEVIRKQDSIAAALKLQDEYVKQEAKRKQDSIDKANAPVNNIVEYKRSTVKLKTESSTTTGIGLVFIDILSDDHADTIRILIPPDYKKAAPVEPKKEEKKFLDIPSVDSAQKDVTKANPVKSNNCKVVASEDDFFKLRKKMVSEKTDNSMIAEASRVFKTKCFSTTQIKNISTLFLTDEFKYKFFDAAYQYVSDAENFASLQSELRDEYYINRFKAMLRF